MQNTYQDLITEVQSKNPQIHHKLEGGKKFKFASDFKPAGDQPDAIKKLVEGAKKNQLSHISRRALPQVILRQGSGS